MREELCKKQQGREGAFINNVKSNQDVDNNVFNTDRFIDRQILLDNVSADNAKTFRFFLFP